MSEGPSWRRQLWSAPFLLTIAVTLLLVLLRIELFVFGDTWFNLVLGREVANSGILHVDRITRVGYGTPVLDIQWLAHLLMYGTARLVGFTGLVTAGAALVAGSAVLGAACAIRAGATSGRTLFSTAAAFMALGAQAVLRAQTLVYPIVILFVAVLWADATRPSRRTWWLVPLGALWANLHGSVLLAPILGGALLAGRLLDNVRLRRPLAPATLRRDGALVIAFAAIILATPYRLEVWRYYRATAGNPVFRDYITEWFPIWSAPDVGLIGLGVVVSLALLFGWRRSDSFPLLVLTGLLVMMVSSVRHATPLALASLVLLPYLLDSALGERLPLTFQELSTRTAAILAAVVSVAFVVGVPRIAGEHNHRPPANSLEQRIAATTYPQCLLVDEQQGDRLMWYFPQLQARLSHTVRVETMPLAFLQSLGRSYSAPATGSARTFWHRFPLVALDDRLHQRVIAVLARDTTFELMGRQEHLWAFRHREAAQLTDPCQAARSGVVLDAAGGWGN